MQSLFASSESASMHRNWYGYLKTRFANSTSDRIKNIDGMMEKISRETVEEQRTLKCSTTSQETQEKTQF